MEIHKVVVMGIITRGLTITFIVAAMYFFIPLHYESHAQWIMPPMPMPDPSSADDKCCSNVVNFTDIEPPVIIIENEILYEGNNVIKMRILDDSPLKTRSISYSVDNVSKATYLAKLHNNEYKALLKVKSPITKVEVAALDVNDNLAKVAKSIKVENRFDNIGSILKGFSFWNNAFNGWKFIER